MYTDVKDVFLGTYFKYQHIMIYPYKQFTDIHILIGKIHKTLTLRINASWQLYEVPFNIKSSIIIYIYLTLVSRDKQSSNLRDTDTILYKRLIRH